MGRFCLGNVLVDKSLWVYLERCLEEVSPVELHGESLMIDGDHWILEISKTVTNSNNLILAFYNRCLRLLECGVTPVVYFDPIKDKTARTDRRRVIDGILDTTSLLEMLWKLLAASNIKVVFAKIAALVDATNLDENGHAGLVTNDLEYILIGGRNVYQIDFLRDGTGIEKIYLFSMGVIEDTFGLSRNRLVALSMLMGCNTFPKGITGIGVVTGIEILSEFSNDKDDHPLTIFERLRAYRAQELPVRKDDSPIKMRLRRMKLRISPTADEIWEDRLDHFMCNPQPFVDERDNPPAFTLRPAPTLQEAARICGLDAEHINSMFNVSNLKYMKATSDIVDEAGTSTYDTRSDLTSTSRMSHTIESNRPGAKRPAAAQPTASNIKKPRS